MIWNTIPNDERLRLWKLLRNDIQSLPVDQQLAEIAKFCSKMPYGARSLDYYSTELWPTPWEILFYGSFCTSSISLLMFYTYILLPDHLSIELLLVEDEDGIYLIPLVDNQYVLNYELGKVNNISDVKDDFKILKTYSSDQIKAIR